jgi:hypothetical protein
MFAVCAGVNLHQLCESVLHTFWLLKEKVVVEEAEGDVEKGVGDSGSGFRAGEGEGVAKKGKEAEEALKPANAKVPKRERYAHLFELAKPLAGFGERSSSVYRDVATGMVALHKNISDRHAPEAASYTQPGGGGASSVPDEPLHPRVVPARGRPGAKCSKSGIEQRGA